MAQVRPSSLILGGRGGMDSRSGSGMTGSKGGMDSRSGSGMTAVRVGMDSRSGSGMTGSKGGDGFPIRVGNDGREAGMTGESWVMPAVYMDEIIRGVARQ